LKKLLLEKIKESVQAILPLTIVITIVLLFFKVDATTIFTFLAGVIMLMVGLVIFSIGSESSIMGLAKEIGAFIVKKKNLVFFLIVALLLGFLITIAEPSVLVLGKQFESTVPLYTMVLTIALGSALFALISLLRVLFKIPIKYLIIVLYAILFTIGCFTHFDFIPVSFDAGGFSTGPMAVPFLLALGFGIVSTQEDSTSEDSFGILGITSMGPIFAVMLLGAFYKNPTFTVDAEGTVKVMAIIIDNLKNVAFAIVPFVIFFIVFQITAFKYPAARVKAILLGFLLTYVGLVLFLSGASLGFMKTGPYLGEKVASLNGKGYLILFGALFAMVIVVAEPSVIVLVNQVQEVTDGIISKKILLPTIVIGVTAMIALAMTRIVFSINILYVVIPVYVIVIILALLVPKMFTGIAIDSGAAVSGALASTFLVPFAIGASNYLYADAGLPNQSSLILQNAFGVMAFLVMAPQLTIQILGLIYKYKTKEHKIEKVEDEFIEL